MYRFNFLKTTCFILFFTFLMQAAFLNPLFGQTGQSGGGGGGSADPTTSSPGISGQNAQMSELSSKADQMPTFPGFRSLDTNFFLGRVNAYIPARNSAGVIQRTNAGGSSGRSASQSTSGNTRSMTTGSRTTRSAAGMRNRNMSTMGNMGRMGGIGGTNTNTVRSVTTLGHSFNETSAMIRSAEAVRISNIENRINNSNKIKSLTPITVELNNSTATLRGVVEDEHQRKLLEQFVKLEPGISRVLNELTLPTEMK